MSFVQRAKEKLQKEVDAYKYNKQLENNPQVVRARLDAERTKMREQTQVLREKQQYESERAQLKELQRNNSAVGRFGNAVKEHLNNVKASQQPARQVKSTGAKLYRPAPATLGTGRNIIYDNNTSQGGVYGNSGAFMQQPQGSRSLILSDEKSKSSVFGHSGGVTGNSNKPRVQKKKQGKTITIRL